MTFLIDSILRLPLRGVCRRRRRLFMLELAHLALALEPTRLATPLLALAQPPSHAARQRSLARRQMRQPCHGRHWPRVVPAVEAQRDARCAFVQHWLAPLRG